MPRYLLAREFARSSSLSTLLHQRFLRSVDPTGRWAFISSSDRMLQWMAAEMDSLMVSDGCTVDSFPGLAVEPSEVGYRFRPAEPLGGGSFGVKKLSFSSLHAMRPEVSADDEKS